MRRYLDSYAEHEARALHTWLASADARTRLGSVRCALIVPVSGERWKSVRSLEAALAAAPASLLVLVVNAHEHSAQETHSENRALLDALEHRCGPWSSVPEVAGLRFGHFANGTLLLLERSSAQRLLPRGAAVGLARKLGNDLALALLDAGILSQPWLYQTDADALPPLDLLTRPLGAERGARVFPFRHVADPDAPSDPQLLLHTLKYEASLRYHVLQLASIRSPYAYHALGSCLAVHAHSYVQVRGFPKRAAGEDFYLLQKIAKLAPVRQLEGDPIRIRARYSDRAPFGTGKAVARLAQTGSLESEAPASYVLLGAWFKKLAEFATHRDPARLGLADRPEAAADGRVGVRIFDAALRELGAMPRLVQLAREAPRADDLLRRSHGWFDALKALRVLHALRVVHAPLGVGEALVQAFGEQFEHASEEPEHWQGICERLAGFENVALCSPNYSLLGSGV